MKQIKIIFPVLLCAILLALSSCKETNADRLKAMCGHWESVTNRPSFTVFESADGYKVTMQRRTRRGETRAETYQIIEKDGYLFIETGFSILVSYDSETERILLSSGGEYVRSKNNQKIKAMKTKIMMLVVALCLFAGNASAQWAVIDPTNLAQGIVNTTKEIAQTSKIVGNTVDTFKETKKLYDQGKQYYDALKSVNNLVKDARKVQKTVLLLGEITDIYVTNFQLMLSDKNFRPEELNAIAFGYSKLLEESSDVLTELKNVVNINGLSMTDAERMERIDKAYNSVLNYRNLVSYYTRKNISVSYLRAKKISDTDRVIALYGTANDRYW